MTSITELLKGGEDVQFQLDGKTHDIYMQPPTAAVARQLRAEFYKLGTRVNKDNSATADLATEFESCIAKIVKACFPPDSDAAQMDDDTIRLFILRIGGDKSEVVKYALRVCGVPLDDTDVDVGDSTDSSF